MGPIIALAYQTLVLRSIHTKNQSPLIPWTPLLTAPICPLLSSVNLSSPLLIFLLPNNKHRFYNILSATTAITGYVTGFWAPQQADSFSPVLRWLSLCNTQTIQNNDIRLRFSCDHSEKPAETKQKLSESRWSSFFARGGCTQSCTLLCWFHSLGTQTFCKFYMGRRTLELISVDRCAEIKNKKILFNGTIMIHQHNFQ